MYVVSVPVKIRDRAVVLTCIEHYEVDQGSEMETAPYSKVVIHFDLPDGHPFEVRAHGIHFTLIDAHTAIFDEGRFCIVEFGGSVPESVIGNFCSIY